MTVIADPFEEIEVPQATPAPSPTYPPSPAQVNFVTSLLDRKLIPDLAAAAKAKVETMERREVSRLIDDLKAMPDLPKAPAPSAVTEDGMYRNPETGDIFKVQKAVHGSGNLYAKRLVVDQAWERDAEGNVLVEGSAHFEYAPGALRSLKAEYRMTLEQAKEFGALYGVCGNCGKTLTDENSIEAGIGPVCAKRF